MPVRATSAPGTPALPSIIIIYLFFSHQGASYDMWMVWVGLGTDKSAPGLLR